MVASFNHLRLTEFPGFLWRFAGECDVFDLRFWLWARQALFAVLGFAFRSAPQIYDELFLLIQDAIGDGFKDVLNLCDDSASL